MSKLVAPSILAADFANLQSEVEMLNQSKADLIHVDIMDGIFVPNISFGFPVMEAIQRHSKKPLDVHLMIEKPERYLENFKKAGAEMISVHYEACPHLHRVLQQIKGLDCKAGIAINPHTSVNLLEDCLYLADLVCVMSVNPGFGGQKFIENTYRKVAELKKIIERNNLDTLIEIDGGVSAGNATRLIDAGADILVAGNFVFSSENPTKTIQDLKESINP